MNFDRLTDGDIQALIDLPKVVKNPGTRWSESRGNRLRDFRVDGDSHLFGLYLRQNLYDIENFSCGLRIEKPSGGHITLLRYNGSNHVHRPADYQCHIHKASQRAIREGKRPEYYATVCTDYWTLDGALCCLCHNASISGLANLKPDEPDLFR